MPQKHTGLHVLAVSLLSASVLAQDDASPPPASLVEGRAQPTATVTAGLGNAFGWAGIQGERYFSEGHFSVFGGLGYVSASSEDDRPPTGAAWAVGARAFTPSTKHRGFAEVSFAEVARAWRERTPGPVEQKHFYGPGVQVGYQRISDGGFTLALSAGISFVLDSSFTHTVQPAGGIASATPGGRRGNGRGGARSSDCAGR